MLMRLSYQRRVKDLREWADQMAGMGRETQKSFLQFCQRQVRENFVYNFRQPALNDQSADEAETDIAQNVNGKMVFFDMAIKMIVLLLQ